MKIRPAYILIYVFTFLSFVSKSQTYSFRKFNVEEGICDRFIYTMNQDRFGYLWLGTGAGLCRFDGFGFRSDVITDSIPAGFIRSSYRDKEGNLWFGHDDGSVSFFDGKNLNILTTNKLVSSRINNIKEDLQGNLVFATQSNGLLAIDQEDTSDIRLIDIGPILVYSVAFTDDNKLIIGTQDSLCLFSYLPDGVAPSFLMRFDSLPETRYQKIHKTSLGEYLVCTSDKGLFKIVPDKEQDYTVEDIGIHLGLDKDNVQDVFEDLDGNLWVSTYRKGLFKINATGRSLGYENVTIFTSENGLDYNDIDEVYQDLEGNIWIGTYGNGLALLLNEALLIFSYTAEKPGESINALYLDREGYLLAGEKGILQMDVNLAGDLEFYPNSRGLSEGYISAIYTDPEGTVWIGTRDRGLFRLNRSERRYISVFQSNNSLDNTINHITGKGAEVWMATRNGVIIYNSQTGDMQQFSTRDGLPHNNINQIYIDSDGRGWVATTSNRLYFIQDGKLSLGYEIQYYTKKNEFKAITVDANDDIWAVTYGNGLYHFTSDSIYNYTIWDGLISDYCYSVESDKADNIWIGHRLGFSRFIRSDSLILTYGRELGITSDCNPNAIFVDNEGAVVFGTTHGIVKYNPSLDKGSRIPPISNITSLSFSDRIIDLSDNIILPYDKYKLKIEFIGLSYRNPELVTYQYKLENYDEEWSEMTRFPQVTYGIDDGEYTFLLRSFNRDWQTSKEPLSVHFIIRKPYWKSWWFITTVVLILIGSVVLIIKIRERNHKRLQAFLQKSLDERTKEVVEKKEEIEQKNREITDSINYAQRIQASILPPLQKLRENFPGFFVLYMPRDIVSGDFYWFDKVGKDRFIVVCADSTGHGVPGAFMSMIGATLIKDIINRQDIIRPSQILTTLDNEITETLNQNIEAEQSTDGMDIIVCEINTST
ncbi:MAG: hypothetical protein AMS23_10850, partial [Bacteroides sp. SM1_62]